MTNVSKVAFYYAFIQCYSLFLVVPTACGAITWLFSGPYSSAFAIFTCLWGVLFVEYWKREEIDLSIRWDVRGVGELKVNRPQYVWEREEVDPVTGQVHRIFPTRKRILRQLWFLPFALLAGLALGTVLLITFALEALMSDVYGGLLEDRWVRCIIAQRTTLFANKRMTLAVPTISPNNCAICGASIHDVWPYRTCNQVDRLRKLPHQGRI